MQRNELKTNADTSKRSVRARRSFIYNQTRSWAYARQVMRRSNQKIAKQTLE